MQNLWGRDIAVLLNQNARKVTRKIVTNVQQFVPEAQLYISRSLDEGQELIRDIVQRDYTHLVCGGGDGTIVETINQLRNAFIEAGRSLSEMPKLGFLKLGTGNAWSAWLGADSGKRSLPRMAISDRWKLRRVNLVESENRLYHFAGMGWDAAILNDYVAMKQRLTNTPLARWMAGLSGYLISTFGKTAPEQIMRRDRPKVRVIAQSSEVYAVSAGNPPVPLHIRPGETLYEGPANAIGAATTPHYGYKLKAFPFARKMDDFMNFRIVKAGVMELIFNWHKIWQGTWKSPNLIDFLVRDVTIEADRPMPLQIGGDAAGERDTLRMTISPLAVNVLDLSFA